MPEILNVFCEITWGLLKNIFIYGQNVTQYATVLLFQLHNLLVLRIMNWRGEKSVKWYYFSPENHEYGIVLF